MTRAWAPNKFDVVDWPVGAGLAIEDDAPEWRSRGSKTRWSNPETRARMLAGVQRSAESRKARAAKRAAAE